MTYTRQELLQSAWESSEWQFPDGYTFADFVSDAGDWDLWPVVVSGSLAGVMMLKENEIHACIKPEYFKRWVSASLYRKVNNYRRMMGGLLTRVSEYSAEGLDFVRRFGFEHVGNDGPVMIFEKR